MYPLLMARGVKHGKRSDLERISVSSSEREPLVKHSENVVYAEGSVWVGAINEMLGSKLPEDRAETIAGLVLDYVGAIPKKDYEVIIDDVKIVVLEEEDNLSNLAANIFDFSHVWREKRMTRIFRSPSPGRQKTNRGKKKEENKKSSHIEKQKKNKKNKISRRKDE